MGKNRTRGLVNNRGSDLIMAYKVSVIVLMVTLVYITLKYWKSKEEKDNCYVNLDKHIKYIKENEKDAKQSKETFEKLVHSRDTEINDLMKDKATAESKLRLCESSGASKDKDIKVKNEALEKKDAAMSDKNGDLDAMIEKYGVLKKEYDKIVASEKKLRNEKEQLESQLSKSKVEEEKPKKKEVEKSKKKEVETEADESEKKAGESLDKKKDAIKGKEKVAAPPAGKVINKVAEPIKKPKDLLNDEETDRKKIDDLVEKEDRNLDDDAAKEKEENEEDDDEN